MSVFSVNDIDYPLTVSVERPSTDFTENGDYNESFATVISAMAVDIQLSLRVRKMQSESETGISDNMVWIMYCDPSIPLLPGDRVSDGTRTFTVRAVGDWGSHSECVLRKEAG